MNNKKYKVVSLFSGCGGMDLGFEGGFTFLNKEYKVLEKNAKNELNPIKIAGTKKLIIDIIITSKIF